MSHSDSTILIYLVIPNCADYVDCFGCAAQDQCAWCASENVCASISDAFTMDCRGLVFELPCPTNYVAGKNTPTLMLFVASQFLLCCVSIMH